MPYGLSEKMKTQLASLIFFLVLTCLTFNVAGSAQATDKSLAARHLTILGLAIRNCTSLDVYSKLGPSIPFRDDVKANVRQACYISDKDETLILFTFENSRCAGVRLLSQKKRFYRWHFCEISPPVSKHLTTGNGIKLGISKSRLKIFLGTPHSESEDALLYFYEWKLESGTAYSPDSRNTRAAPAKTVRATIRAEFSDAKLISFDVSKTMQ